MEVPEVIQSDDDDDRNHPQIYCADKFHLLLNWQVDFVE